MKIVRFFSPEQTVASYGLVEESQVTPIVSDPFSPGGQLKRSALRYDLDRVTLIAPVMPSKIVLVGLNYRDHAAELGMEIPREPVLFMKPPTSVVGPGERIVCPRGVKRLDYEAELAVIIGKEARHVREGRERDYILGYTCLNDVTARDLQEKDGQWTRAKSFDTFCPLGPHIETDLDPTQRTVRLYLNGILRQESATRNLIFPVDYLLRFISAIMTLLPGDVIATGTPPGVGPMRAGDTVTVDIGQIGTLTNTVS